MLRALVLKKRIETTHARAQETSAFADKMITIAKRDGLHARRLLISKVRDPEIARILITQIAPLFKGREGGYTRVLRLAGYRKGDGAQLAILEWTATFEAPAKKTKKKKAAKSTDKEAQKPAAKEPAKAADLKKEAEAPKQAEKKDSEKKGGFLGKLRKFLKGDEN
jgi:large subunit ribosomal protein L17